MLQWEYVRIMNRNYIQAKVERNQENTFHYRMIMSGPINGLLQCKEREINGTTYLLFDISSMQNMTSIYSEKKMDFTSFYELIYSMKCVAGNIRLHLLELEKLIFFPELIYRELDTGEMKFVCIPCGDAGEENSMKSLYQFLLSVIDYDDSELAEFIYDTYEEIEENISFSWLENLYERLNKIQDERLQKKKNIYDESKDSIMQPQDELLCEEFQRKTSDSQVESVGKIALIGAIYVIAVGIAIYYLYSNYTLSTQENIITIGAVIIATAIIAFWMFLWLKNREKRLTDEKEDIIEYSEIPVQHDIPSWEDNIYGKTVFFDPEKTENKLYGIGENNRIKIQIEKFPFVVGKKSDVVDEVIDDVSVSRMHARFEKEGEVIFIEDLNSTNGTYKNGIMLTPHQKIEVFPDDEIWFGRLRFVYR